ncbi:hypothetical protein CO641_02245 [Lysobacteraceae bacterium NML91-0213]|nr:hypothetical protein CO641_02245 [Xanthomonadaceae bacterium NML91-0213]
MAILGLYALIATAIVVRGTGHDPAPVVDPGIPTVTQPRVCAAVAVYSQATIYDWSQHAVIARAALNLYQGETGPDCSPDLAKILRGGLDTLRWQRALDAVDAVDSGSYDVPLACARVNRVVHVPHDAVGPGPQCVIAGLAFAEVRS